MLGNIKASTLKQPKQATAANGFTIVELLIAILVGAILIGTMLSVTFLFYGGVIKENYQARLAVEAQGLLRSVTDELRTSSGVRDHNTIADPHASGGWSTSDSNLVLIISTPVVDSSGDFITNPTTGGPYQNEIVYFAENGTLYKRYLATTAVADNRYKTSCPAVSATASCPADVVLTEHFDDMQFTFYDQNNNPTTNLGLARAAKITIKMQRQAFGDQTINFNSTVRVTMRNSTS